MSVKRTDLTDPDYATLLDERDPLSSFRAEFHIGDPELIYLDGNSLGRLPRRTEARLGELIHRSWGEGLVGSWASWRDLPRQLGDRIGVELLGARPGEVLVSDSTSVNLYKLAAAAIAARPGRRAILTDTENFPTDRYVLEGLAHEHHLELRMVPSELDGGVDDEALAAALDDEVALVSLSHVSYRSAAILDLKAVSELAHRQGALVLFDLAHSVGALPIALGSDGVDLAVGCTYKYLNAGPGAPAFLYVRRELQSELRQPIWGWFGQDRQFEMGAHYDPRSDVERFSVGTPPILSLAGIEPGVELVISAGIERIRAKAVEITSYAVELCDLLLAPLGFTLASPRDPARRGNHVTLHHEDAYRITQALVAEARVVTDYRTPDRLRLAPTPLTTSYAEVLTGITRIAELVASGRQEHYDRTLRAIT
jgi:kynureninase